MFRWDSKQCRPWPDCSFRSSSIWVCTVCTGLSVPTSRSFLWVFLSWSFPSKNLLFIKCYLNIGTQIMSQYYINQLLQLCTARTAWSDSVIRSKTSLITESDLASVRSNRTSPRSDSVIKLVSVLFGKCTTLVITKYWPMETRLPLGDQWKAEKSGAF